MIAAAMVLQRPFVCRQSGCLLIQRWKPLPYRRVLLSSGFKREATG